MPDEWAAFRYPSATRCRAQDSQDQYTTRLYSGLGPSYLENEPSKGGNTLQNQCFSQNGAAMRVPHLGDSCGACTLTPAKQLQIGRNVRDEHRNDCYAHRSLEASKYAKSASECIRVESCAAFGRKVRRSFAGPSFGLNDERRIANGQTADVCQSTRPRPR